MYNTSLCSCLFSASTCSLTLLSLLFILTALYYRCCYYRYYQLQWPRRQEVRSQCHHSDTYGAPQGMALAGTPHLSWSHSFVRYMECTLSPLFFSSLFLSSLRSLSSLILFLLLLCYSSLFIHTLTHACTYHSPHFIPLSHCCPLYPPSPSHSNLTHTSRSLSLFFRLLVRLWFVLLPQRQKLAQKGKWPILLLT